MEDVFDAHSHTEHRFVSSVCQSYGCWMSTFPPANSPCRQRRVLILGMMVCINTGHLINKASLSFFFHPSFTNIILTPTIPCCHWKWTNDSTSKIPLSIWTERAWLTSSYIMMYISSLSSSCWSQSVFGHLFQMTGSTFFCFSYKIMFKNLNIVQSHSYISLLSFGNTMGNKPF